MRSRHRNSTASTRSRKQQLRRRKKLNLERLEARQLLTANVADDFFSLAADASLNVLVNDTTGAEVQTVSGMNVEAYRESTDPSVSPPDNFIPERPGQPGVPQRSVFPGAVTLDPSQQNLGDIDLYLDSDVDPSNDEDVATVQRLNRANGLVLGTLRDNNDLDADGTNLAVVQYAANESGDAWVATNAAPENAGEQAADFSAAYFPYAAGWRGASFDGETHLAGDTGMTATGSSGVYEVTVDGVVDSFNDGFLMGIGGDNVDNYTRTRPLGGNRWSVIHRDNSNSIGQSDGADSQQEFNLLYVPRSAQGLIGGVVKGAATEVNPMRQSFGDFEIQRQSDGLWKLTVPGQNITTGMLVMETADASNERPRNAYFTYDVDPADDQSILIRQFGYNRPNAELLNEDFTFFFVPFDNNTLAPSSQLSISRLGSSAASLGDSVSEKGVPLSLNADGTVNYDTSSAIVELGQGQSLTDTFAYEVVTQDEAGNDVVSTATATILQRGVNDAPVVTGQPDDVRLARNGTAVEIDLSPLFGDVDATDALSYSVEFSSPDVATATFNGNSLTVAPVADASGTVAMTVIATDTAGATASVTAEVAVVGLQAVDDEFFITNDTVLSVLNNDLTGSELQNVSAINVEHLHDTIDKDANRAEYFIPSRPGQPSVPQRSVFEGALTITTSTNYGDIGLYLDQDDDPSNDGSTGNLQRISRSDGVVLGTLRDNSELDESATNLAVVSFASSYIATNAAPENASEQAADFSSAFFPYSGGWVGGTFNANAETVDGGAGLTVTGSGGRYEVEVEGVSDSFSEGFLFAISGANSDNYTRAQPVGGNRWLVQNRDNSNGLNQSQGGDFNLVYIPRSSQGLVGGVVNGSSNAVNSLRQSFGDFTVQRESDGFWRVSVPGESPTSGVLVMETMDLTADAPRNSYFTYEAAEDNPDDFIIRQFDYSRNPSTLNPQNGDFAFFFIPFENTIQPATPINVGRIGSSVADLGNNQTAKGIPISMNADGTINYETDGAIRAMAEGQTDVDSFVYEAQFGGETVVATATINHIGTNDAPEMIASPGEMQIVEDGTMSLDVSEFFTDIDAGDLLSYSINLSRGGIVDATVDGSVVTINGLENQFGFLRATLTATDRVGASLSVDIPILVTTDTDGPVAVDETTGVLNSRASSIDVLANDVHPDSGPFQVVSANIFGNGDATDNATTTWAVEQTGSSPNNMTILVGDNRGDLVVGRDGDTLLRSQGVLLGTIRNDQDPFGSVNAYQGFSGTVPPDGSYTFATAVGANGNGERNAPLGAAYLPFSEGWTGGHVATDGTLEIGNGVSQSNVAQVADGLWTVSIPGVTDSNSDGMLFVMSNANDDNLVTASPLGGDSWMVRQSDNDADEMGFENDSFSFVYVPIDTPELIGGRWKTATMPTEGEEQVREQASAGIDLSAGSFTATDSGYGKVTVDIPGASPSEGALIVMPTGAQSVLLPDGSTEEIPVNHGAFYAGTSDGKFEVETRQSGTFSLIDSSFQFIYVPFADPLRTELSAASTFSITQVDAVSTLGASVSLSDDGSIAYDPTSAGGPIASLGPKESVLDSFDYTITDGNGLTSTTTATVEVFGSTGVTIVESDGSTNVSEDGPSSDTFDLALLTEPTADVTVTIQAADGEIMVDLGTIIFTNSAGANPWNSSQALTITAVDDSDAEGAHSGRISFSVTSDDPVFNGIDLADLTVTVQDNDQPPADVVPPTVTSVIAAGSSWAPAFIDEVDGGGLGSGNGLGLELPHINGASISSGIDTVYARFSEDVQSVTANQVSLLGGNTSDYSNQILSVSYDSSNFMATIVLSSTISFDKLRLALSESLADTAGNALDGDSSGAAGGVFDFRFDVLVGDGNGDGRVNGNDLAAFGAAFNTQAGQAGFNASADWNADGRINGNDLARFGVNFDLQLGTVNEPAPASFGAAESSSSELSELELYSLAVDSIFAGLDDDDEEEDAVDAELSLF